MKQEKSCGAIVFSQKDDTVQFLLIQHINGGHWSFPKGHVESGESETQTALREIKEETGLEVTLNTGFRRVTSYSPTEGICKEVVYFVARAKDPRLNLQKEEVKNAGWYSYEKAKEQITYPNDAVLLEAAADYIINLHTT